MSSIKADRDVRAMVQEILPSLIEIRHDLHAHPELSFEETRTSRVVCEQLDQLGIEYRNGLAGSTGVLSHLPGDSSTAIGLRADMDALPITEETGLPWASTTDGCMHACGHDGHTTILLGAAHVLSRIASEQQLPRGVSLVFQPAEEGGGGGARMVEDGCLDGSVLGPPIDSMFGLHGWPQHPIGEVMTRPGPMLAAAVGLEIAVRGNGCHAAFPQHGNDAVLCAAAIIAALQQVSSRNVDPLDSVVISITQVHGGTTHNILPDEVLLTGTLRYLLDDTGDHAKRRIREIVEATAKAHGCTADLTILEGDYPVTANHADAVDRFFRIARETLGDDRVSLMEHPVMGGEDFSFYCKEVPSCFFALGLIPQGQESMATLHQPTFDFNDDAIGTGVELFCNLALDVS